MAFDITAWNLSPNQDWYVRLSDGTTGITVDLYDTLADAQAQENIVATATTTGFGTDVEVLFVGQDVDLYQTAYDWYMKVSGTAGDTTRIYLIKEFVELDEIDHPIFRNSALITTRGTAEIDTHTHAVIKYNVSLGSHLTGLAPGDVITLNATRRGLSKTLQVLEHIIAYSTSESGQTQLTSDLIVTEYIALKR